MAKEDYQYDQYDIASMATVLGSRKHNPDKLYEPGQDVLVDCILKEAQENGIYEEIVMEMRRMAEQKSS